MIFSPKNSKRAVGNEIPLLNFGCTIAKSKGKNYKETTATTPKSPFKTRFESLGYFFGSSLESFDDLLSSPSSPSSSASVNNSTLFDNGKVIPTDFHVLKHWINVYDKTRTSKRFSEANLVIWIVTDNLIEYWGKNSSKELW